MFVNFKIITMLLLATTFILPAEAVDFSSVPGTVIDYIESPTRLFGFPLNPVYISDPSIVVLDNGDYIASHAVFGWGSNSSDYGETSVFHSSDQGQTWTYLTTLEFILRASLFVHNGDLYLLGTYKEGGQNVIRKSTDNGSTWTEAVDSQTGLLGQGGLGTPNNPVVIYDRIWSGATRQLFSAPVNADLLKASSWTITNSPSETGHPFGDDWQGWTEGQAVASPQTGVYVLPKIRALPHTARIKAVSPTNVSFTASAAHAFPDLPGGEKKFGAGYDEVSGKFYILSNPVLAVHAGIIEPELTRTAAAVVTSRDLINWQVEKIFLFTENIDNGSFGEGFQYFNFAIDGNDLAVVSRTAFDVGSGERQPPRGHDSNLMTFHMIENFRNLSPEHILVLDTNNDQVLRFEITDHQDAPLGSFTLGSSFDGAPLSSPDAIGQAQNGDVYISEQAGRILRFDALGNFIETVAQSPVPLQTGPLPITQCPAGNRTWAKAGSGNWREPTNWYYWGRADTEEEIANFGSAADSPTQITIDLDYVVKGLCFRNQNGYTLAGNGPIYINTDAGKGIIQVCLGSHEISVPLTPIADTDVEVYEDAELHLKEAVNINGKDFFIEGRGRIFVHDDLELQNGNIISNGLAPLTFAQGANAILDGSLTFVPHESLEPEAGSGFKLLDGTQYISDTFDNLNLPQLPQGLIWDVDMLYTDGTVTVGPDLDFVDLNGFSYFSLWWLENCNQQKPCSDFDFDGNDFIDIVDLRLLTEKWL